MTEAGDAPQYDDSAQYGDTSQYGDASQGGDAQHQDSTAGPEVSDAPEMYVFEEQPPQAGDDGGTQYAYGAGDQGDGGADQEA